MDYANCLCKSISPDEMEKIKLHAPDEITSLHLAEFFKVFGDATRLRIIYYLSRHELCVADLSTLVQMQQSAVSHQLKLLRLQRLVKTRREGKIVYYSLDDKHIDNIFSIAMEHLGEK
jgi:ArsR family transcriptional regulator